MPNPILTKFSVLVIAPTLVVIETKLGSKQLFFSNRKVTNSSLSENNKGTKLVIVNGSLSKETESLLCILGSNGWHHSAIVAVSFLVLRTRTRARRSSL